MPDLREQLQRILRDRVCLVGVGNVESGDDGFGVRLAEALATCDVRCAAGEAQVLVAGVAPERELHRLTKGEFDVVLFLDAVEFGAAPGAVVLLDSTEMSSRFPQISTHKISLGLLAQMIEATGRTKVWLLGMQPESLKPGRVLSSSVEASLHALTELLREALDARELGGTSERQTPPLTGGTGKSGSSAFCLLPSALPC